MIRSSGRATVPTRVGPQVGFAQRSWGFETLVSQSAEEVLWSEFRLPSPRVSSCFMFCFCFFKFWRQNDGLCFQPTWSFPGWTSVDPGHRDPLAGCAHQIDGLLQEPDGLVDLVVDYGLVEVVGVGFLQDLRLLLQPLQRLVLQWEEKHRMSGHSRSGGRAQKHFWTHTQVQRECVMNLPDRHFCFHLRAASF